MNKIRIAKIAGIAVGASLALGSFVPMVGAQSSIADLQAQINALMAQLSALQGGGSATGGQALSNFNTNLTIGSTGSDVSALQSYLVTNGYLVMPVGVSKGYFGSLTKAAVARWQAANGVSPAVGYFGPISRTRLNGLIAVVPGPGPVVTPTPGCPTGALFNSVTGASCTAGGVITTPGVEGTITASKDATPASGTKAYEGGAKVGVLGIKLEAKISDIKIERVKLKLDFVTSGNSDQQFYTKIADNIYVMDGSTVLASMPLNATTVVKEGSDYYVTVSGFSFIVPKDATKVLTIAIDPKASWDSTFDNDSWKVTVPVDGVRGVDGAGINEFSPATAFNNEFTSAADVVDSAALTVSLATDSPITSQVIASEGSSDNELDGLTLAKFNFKGEKDQILVTDLVVDVVRGTTLTTASSTTGYIYDGSTLVGSASIIMTTTAAGSFTFSDIDWIVPADTTRTLTFKVDIDTAGLLATTFAADIGATNAVATNVTSENSAGSSVTETGSAQGKTITVRKVGPEVTLVSKSIITNGVSQTNDTLTKSTSTLTATFNVKVKAVGGTLTLGTVASGTPVIASSTASFKVYRNGAYDGAVSSATSTSYTIPSGCTSTGTNSCTLTDGNDVTIPVTFKIEGREPGGTVLSAGLYAIGFEGIQWWNATTGTVQTTTFMAGETDWRTADVSFP
ncbi:MAG: peptidoglycan-binding protein [bacterium]|nr:peptidoglycan-binding protein [bacterium]